MIKLKFFNSLDLDINHINFFINIAQEKFIS